MTATAASTRPPYVSGFCGQTAAHERCPNSVGTTTCSCRCHSTCPTCHQQLPVAPDRQETRP